MIKENGLVPQDRPIRTPSVAVLFADPASGPRARKLFEKIMCQRLGQPQISAGLVLASLEEEVAAARSLQHLLRLKPTLILIAFTTKPARLGDAVARAILRGGCRIERVLASVDPGMLLLPSYRDYPDRVTARMYPLDQAESCSSCTSIVIGEIPQSDWDVVSLERDGL
jgi:hypothetical protein